MTKTGETPSADDPAPATDSPAPAAGTAASVSGTPARAAGNTASVAGTPAPVAGNPVLAAGNEAMLEGAFRTGEYEAADRAFRQVLAEAQATGDRALEAAALDRMGWLMHFRALDDDPARADSAAEEALFQRSLALSRELGDPAGTAAALFGLGLVHQVLREDWDAAMPCYTEALALAEKHGDLLLRSEVHRHVGFYYAHSDLQSDQALAHLRISHELRARLGDPRWIPGGTMALGIAELADGLREQGLAHIREAVGQAREAGLTRRRVEWMENFLREAEAGQ